MPTIKDVAAEAGVTSTTVSRVLNNRGYISEETREKVYSAMEKLNYMPNEMARNLSRQKSDYIGVILPSVEHPYFSKVLHWLEHYVTKHNYKIMVCISENSREKELQYIDLLYSHRVLGIVVCSHIGETMEHLDSNCPLISFEREIAENIPAVLCDNYQGGILAANRLFDAGCRNIAIFNTPTKENIPAYSREKAFMKCCEDKKISGRVVYTDRLAPLSEEFGNNILELLKKNSDLDGIFATSDVMAANIIRACKKMGKRVPEDISIAGYDGITIAKILEPKLTTLCQDTVAIGRIAAEKLIDLTENPKTTLIDRFTVDGTLFKGASVRRLLP